jgi:hypothetical protein
MSLQMHLLNNFGLSLFIAGIRSVDLYYGPTAPKGKEKNWVQTIPGQGWWVYLRFYAPTKAYFDKSWSIGNFEKLK